MGRVLTEQRTIGTITKTISYGYKLDGSLASVTYPSGRKISYDVGTAGRPLTAKDTANGVNYALSGTYAPQGALATVINGQVSGGFAGITWTASYNNRLAPTSVVASSSAGTALSLGFSYLGNLNVSTITNNRDTGRTETFTYDELNRLTSTAGVSYTYDGDGKRVKKSNGTLYWNDLSGTPLAETDHSGNTTNEYIFFAGGRIARRDGSGHVSYYFGDHLGSSRGITQSDGTLCYDADFYPFGGELNFLNTCGQNYKFAGMERDSESGLDHTLFRQYTPTQGR